MSITKHGAMALTPFLSTDLYDGALDIGDVWGVQSTWLVVPYFTVYATMFVINTVISPILLLERSCINSLPDIREKQQFVAEFSSPNRSCIAMHMMNRNATDTPHVVEAFSNTLYIMISIIFASGNLSAISYFLIWKPLLSKYRNLALFLPPGLVLLQTVFLTVAQDFEEFNSYKYMILGSGMLPGLHGGLPGVFLLFYRMTKNRRTDASVTQEIMTTKLDCIDATFPSGILLSGLCIYVWFDMRYYFLFMLQFALGVIGLVYALSLLTVEHAFMTGNEKIAEDDEASQHKKKTGKARGGEGRLDSDSDSDDDRLGWRLLCLERVKGRCPRRKFTLVLVNG